jgi:hypothetical protein
MDFPERIETIEGNQRDSWNDDIEEYLGKPQSTLQNSISVEFDDAALQSSLQTVALDLEKRLGASFRNCEAGECDPNIGSVVRTGKNLLRWYIQIYLEHLRVQRRRHKSQGGCKIDVLRSPDTLNSVIQILKWSVEGSRNLKLARDASLYIFYATYSHFPGDKSASTGIDHLISHLEFPKECLEIMMKTNAIPLALTLVRNLHSMTVSFPTARTSILDANVWCDPLMATQLPPWAPREATTINFSQSCLALMRWSLDVQPSFPSENPEDKRAELVIEILNCFYAMRKGQELVEPTSGFTRDNDNPSLEHSIVRILQLKLPARSNTEGFDETISKRIVQCQLSAVSLLTDSDVSFGKYLVEIGSFEKLLEIFKRQVDDIVDNKRVDSTATAALVPILVVLNRYSVANSVVQQTVKAFVFPTETEKNLQQSIKENRKTKMSPLDAPKNTLRGKLIVLLSWVDGYIKRCSAELMWTLCDSNSSEFTVRVGLGNALPLLNSKGLSPIPIPS